MTNLEEGDIVLCTVDRIVGTVVFVRISLNGKEVEGSIVLSEIAPGRIRNLRDYVVPKKKIICKVLRISRDRIDLSLRRVTLKEKKEKLEENKQEESSKSILKKILGEDGEKIIKEISETEKVYDFLQESKENPKKLEKLVGKEKAKRILEILKAQKQKKYIVKKEIILKSTNPEGVDLIKKILDINEVEIKYISAGRYILKKESGDLKTADNSLKETILKIEKEAKKQEMDFSIKEK
ncbi:MAG: hypothetical protein Q8P15_00715 [Nanoarchaeota archaeon]|nr:hypothetical protein [Nanoarchaeota archaeon]